MTDIAVRAVGIGKRYRIGQLDRSATLREAIHRVSVAPLRHLRSAIERPSEDDFIWALRDVAFELERGSVLGIIGRNGAGKSTLLKILSRITEPTEGYADVFGQLASLLEVGTGFHPELSGRDNVYLNGAILGMRRGEVARKFDEIVDFAGVGKFIDTPVKRYSSGMYMRLAFAVAAHLEPDILVVDEVLAVGDAEFQRRSLGKMREVTGEGRTVLFVSHNMAAIKTLCQRAILLEGGSVVADGEPDAVVGRYLSTAIKADGEGIIPKSIERVGDGLARFTHVHIHDTRGERLHEALIGQTIAVTIGLEISETVNDAVLEVGISAVDGVRCTTAFTVDDGTPPLNLDPGHHTVCVELSPVLLPGFYSVDLGIHHAGAHAYTMDYVERVADFEVVNIGAEGFPASPYPSVRGYVRAPARWGEVNAGPAGVHAVGKS